MSNKVRKKLDSLIAEIKQIPIEKVVDRLGLQLHRSGSNLQGNCPTGHPSKSERCFNINLSNNLYYCFSCRIGGDVISLVEEVKKLPFARSIEWLAKEFSVHHDIDLSSIEYKKLSDEEMAAEERSLVLTSYYEPAFEWMHELLFQEQGKEALNYLVNERKYDVEVLKKSEFCFFPNVGEIRKYLKDKFPEKPEQIDNLPLNGAYGDKFRVSAPYRNIDGRITGFVKRATSPKGIIIDGKEVRWDSTKGLSKKDLFNFDKVQSQETILIVEGYPDAIYFSALGMDNITAVGQGILTENHIEGLKSSKIKNVIISFDNDDVGPRNTRDAVELINNKSKIVPFVLDPQLLSPHKDPDEYVKANGIEAFQLLLKKSEKGLIWLAKQISNDCDIDSELSREKIITMLLTLAASTTDAIVISKITELITQRFIIDKATVNKMLKTHKINFKIDLYKRLGVETEDRRYFPFIEKATSSYSYYDSEEDEVYLGVPTEILENILSSNEQTLPEVFPILKADFNVMMNERYDLEKEIFNFFVPTEYMLLRKNDEVIKTSERFPSIEKLLVNLIPVTEERLRFINWLAGILQTRQKQQTAWVFKGKPGAGKGIMLEHVFKPLFGPKQAIKVEDEQLTAQFNPWLQNALLIAFNEVAHDNRTRNSINSKVKAIITDSEVIINEKNIRNYTITNYVNCLFFSNEEVPVFIEQGDRRFNVVVTGSNLREKDWFSNPDEFINNLEKEVPPFAQFLMNWDYDKIAAMTCIENDDKKMMVGVAMNRFEEFAMHLKNNDVEWFEENASPLLKSHYEELNGRIKKSSALKLFEDIYASYTMTDSELGKKLKLYGISAKRDRSGGLGINYYVWGGK